MSALLLAHASCWSCFLIRRVFIGNALLSGCSVSSCFPIAASIVALSSLPSGSSSSSLSLCFTLPCSHTPRLSAAAVWADVLGASRSKSSPLTFLCQSFHGNKGRRCLKPAFLLLWQERGVPVCSGVPGAFQAGTRDLQRSLPVLLPDG